MYLSSVASAVQWATQAARPVAMTSGPSRLTAVA
jgi:hypothetical protein